LKQVSVDSNRLWKAAGSPRHGPIFNNRQSHPMIYRKRIRQEQHSKTQVYTNKLHDALMLKTVLYFENAGAQNLICSRVVLNKLLDVVTKEILQVNLLTIAVQYILVIILHLPKL